MLLLGLISQDLFIVAQKYKASKKKLSQFSTAKLISSISSKKAIIAQVIDFILHVVYNRPKRKSREKFHTGESRYAMPFITKGKTKKFVEIKLLPPDKQSLHMKILEVNFVSCGRANCVNQHFEILNLVDDDWNV